MDKSLLDCFDFTSKELTINDILTVLFLKILCTFSVTPLRYRSICVMQLIKIVHLKSLVVNEVTL